MEAYCISFKKYTEKFKCQKNRKKYINAFIKLCCLWQGKLFFIKNQELNNVSNYQFKMNRIINKFLLTGDKSMPELHLKQPVFIYSTCGPFTKHR